MRKIGVVTNSRADYSRLKTILQAIKDSSKLELQVYVIGTHLLWYYGDTIKEIQKDGFDITYKLHNEIEGRIPVTMAKSTGLIISDLSSAFYNFKPDVVVVHGDRFEAMAATIAASFMNIPVAHIQGGEVTGSIDEHIRHAITKLSHFHFPSNEEAKERIIRLGEKPESVFNFGCPSVDVLLSTPVLSFKDLKSKIFEIAAKERWKKKFSKNFFLVVQHPVTTEMRQNKKSMTELFQALKKFNQSIVMLWPNIDAGAEEMVLEVKKNESDFGERIGVFPSFPLDVFINIMRHAKVMIGNSSAGLREACYFGLPVVNIGNRQSGRKETANVATVPPVCSKIEQAIKRQLEVGKYKKEFVYGKGDSGKRIAEVLSGIDIENTQKVINF
ncbi:MAG: UDP-N-acetylglucosamine 2-epimerase [Candidatus Marinimicrobia bacterium]|nr:UDP-N-acetylglucosamine 2-epimerase [Candidatus Neomarinimicrobiota bacterium]